MPANTAKTADDSTVTTGSGNVFADLGIPNAADYDRKAEVAIRIMKRIKARQLSQVAAAKLTGLTQPQVSLVTRGLLDGFSLERLLGCLEGLGTKVRTIFEDREATSSTRKTLEGRIGEGNLQACRPSRK